VVCRSTAPFRWGAGGRPPLRTGPDDVFGPRPTNPAAEPAISFFTDYLGDPFTREVLLELTLEHAILVLVPIAIGTALGITLGIVANRHPALRATIMNTTSTFLTIPSLALFGLMIPIVGIGSPPVIVALVMYSLLPITRNTLAGLGSVDQAVVESARGMGMSGNQRLWRIELPNAWPVILAGVRVSTQLIVGIAPIAALIGGPGLGNEIFSQGIRRIGSPGALNAILGGTLGVLVLALLFDLAYRGVEQLTVSEGLQ
jgi:osmoprotectant transport system permease protein